MASLTNLVFRRSGCMRVSFLVDGKIAQMEGVRGAEEGVLYWVK